MPIERVKNIVTFSFQHAPLGNLPARYWTAGWWLNKLRRCSRGFVYRMAKHFHVAASPLCFIYASYFISLGGC